MTLLVFWAGIAETGAQSGFFSIFRQPQQSDIAPQADAEEDAAVAAPPLHAQPAPELPLPPGRQGGGPSDMPAGPLALAAMRDFPMPRRRAEGEAPGSIPEPARKAAIGVDPAPPPETDILADRPSMVVTPPSATFRPMRPPPLQRQETTPEELELEERRTPEPLQVEKQTDHVDIACLRPELLVLMRKAGDRFGAAPVITSGQRDRGRAGSYHRRCMAADFFVPGVARADLARYLRSLPEAGGVGTYCHTKSVHVDLGEPRNWSQCGFRFRFAQRG